MTGISQYFSVRDLSVNDLNSPILRHRTAECIQNKNVLYTRNTFTKINKLKSKDQETIFHAMGIPKQAEVGLLFSDKVYFKPKASKRGKGYYILVKEN